MAIRIAVFGLNQGARLAREAVKDAEAELVAVAGMGRQAEDAAAELGVPLYADYADLLGKERLDAAIIALPNSLHVASVRACLDAGVGNILLEKPVANTVGESREIIDMCEAAGAMLLVGHHRRSSTKLRFLRGFLDSGRLGDIVGIQSTYAIAKPHAYFAEAWRMTKGGGPLLINAVHDIDDLLFVMGSRVTRVYATTRNFIRGNAVEDSASILFEFENGATATYFLSDGTPGPWNYDLQGNENSGFCMSPGENSMHVFGTKGSFGYPNMDFYRYDEAHFGWAEPLIKEHFGVADNRPMEAEFAHFMDLCSGREAQPRCTGEDGLNDVAVIAAIKRSAETGQVVEL